MKNWRNLEKIITEILTKILKKSRKEKSDEMENWTYQRLYENSVSCNHIEKIFKEAYDKNVEKISKSDKTENWTSFNVRSLQSTRIGKMEHF